MCTDITGLICYSTTGTGSCRKNVFGPFGYLKIESGKCGDVQGRTAIPDIESCNAAAKHVGLNVLSFPGKKVIDAFAEPPLNIGRPHGCFYENSMFYHNKPTSIAGCEAGVYDSFTCLCFVASECIHKFGTKSNNDYCMCGTSACTPNTGFFCTFTTNTCSKGNPCVIHDGTAANAEDCS